MPKGKKVPLGDLFYGLLLVSGNDAAIGLVPKNASHPPAGLMAGSQLVVASRIMF